MRVAVLGAGRMGAALAAEYAHAGYSVRITSSVRTPATTALARVGCDGVGWSPSTSEAASGADLVVEALPEVLECKRHELGAAQAAAPAAILATNTSSFRIGEVGAGLEDPTRLVGAHFFYPPSAFSLVELISGDDSDPGVIDQMSSVLRSLNKVPIRVRRDVPGFVINRLQFALVREALELVDTGVIEPSDLDRLVAEGLGRRWAATGPFATVALGGPELFGVIAERLYPSLSQATSPPASLDRLGLSEGELAQLLAKRAEALSRWPQPSAPG
jgi:3-hydroxybutyryl-CoA dehydrogenase